MSYEACMLNAHGAGGRTPGHVLRKLIAGGLVLLAIGVPVLETWKALFLAICLTFILLAPGGQWANRVIGVPLWWNGDPGAGYVVGSLYAFTPSRHEFVGHPGLPIQLAVGAFAHLIYFISRISGGGESFFDFWARNFRGLFILGSCIIALFHVASFHVLFAFAKRIAGDAKIAFIAVLAYATSLPVLFYASRVSPEPLLVIAFLLTVLSLWNAIEFSGTNSRKARNWTILAALATVFGVYSKIHLAALLPPGSKCWRSTAHMDT